ncbi:acetyl-CoA synthetase [Actinocorallia sp. A-T 12471]|uniref:acetyl-CoA synthetase n=1 Tax=Actinocorallia sp. A-T 12471 TaxID=3089813 RepID=UPI0029CC439E|nr:acetyl-CoA synthetase [Actinocorallia sp. A-T 12471]MDX6741488.1 acetyl-CoA synthetase [Actinocorallia sp. A-T 12471]
MDPRTPCLVGVGQRTYRRTPAPEPLEQWAEAAAEAAKDSGAPGLLGALDSLQVVYCESWSYDDPAGRLAALLGADPRQRRYSGIGGNVPQRLVGDAAAAIARGEMDVALVVGGEALATRRAARKAGERTAWSFPATPRPPYPLEVYPLATELAHGVHPAWLTFALLETARRAASGESPQEERRSRGAIMSAMSAVAEANPYAWFRQRRAADELVTPTPGNRLVGSPYTKHTVAVIDVDMSAAVLLTSTAAADAAGVPADRRVYLRGQGYAEDAWHIAARADLDRSAAMRAASAAALTTAGLGLDDIGVLDLYACFGSAVRFACDALGLDPGDPRGLTVTGGLPFAGGPGSAYLLHALATLTGRLREEGGHGLLSGVGMHMTKHIYGVWSAEPGFAAGVDLGAVGEPREVVDRHEGDAVVAACSVVHGRDGVAERGIAVVELPDGARAYGWIEDPALLAEAGREEPVGRTVRLTAKGEQNIIDWEE